MGLQNRIHRRAQERFHPVSISFRGHVLHALSQASIDHIGIEKRQGKVTEMAAIEIASDPMIACYERADFSGPTHRDRIQGTPLNKSIQEPKIGPGRGRGKGLRPCKSCGIE
jgi:hypothetical protein